VNFSITKIEKGFYIDAKIYRHGKVHRKRHTVIGTSKKTAERIAFQIVMELEEKAECENQSNPYEFKTFGECSDYYKRLNPLKKGSISTYNLNYERFKLCLVEDMPRQLELFQEHLKNSVSRLGTPYSGATINRFLVWVMIVLNYAADWDKIEKNPIKKLRKEKEMRRDRILSEDEKQRFFTSIQQHRPYLLPIVQFAIQVPSRVDELRNAVHQNVAADFKSIKLDASTTKNNMDATKPIPKNMVKYFSSLPTTECPWVFYRYESGVYHQLKNFSKAWKFVLQKAGIDDFTFHDLRHCSTTDLVARGLKGHMVKEVMSTTTDMTGRYINSAALDAAEKVHELLPEEFKYIGNDDHSGEQS